MVMCSAKETVKITNDFKFNPKKITTQNSIGLQYFVLTFQSAMSGWVSANGGGWNQIISSGETRSHAQIQKIFPERKKGVLGLFSIALLS